MTLLTFEPGTTQINSESFVRFVIELNPLYTTQLTVVFYSWLHQQHVSALLGHHQAYKVYWIGLIWMRIGTCGGHL